MGTLKETYRLLLSRWRRFGRSQRFTSSCLVSPSSVTRLVSKVLLNRAEMNYPLTISKLAFIAVGCHYEPQRS